MIQLYRMHILTEIEPEWLGILVNSISLLMMLTVFRLLEYGHKYLDKN